MLLLCVADEQIARMRRIQNNAARLILKKIEARSCHSAFDRTPLAPSKIPHSVQARNARFPSLRRHFSAVPVFFSLHISTTALPSFFDRTTAQNSKKTNLKTFGGRSFGYIAPTVWNSLPADLRASPSLQSFKKLS